MITNIVQGRWLAPFTGDPEPRCPACLSKAVQTEFHDTVVVGMCKERREGIIAMSDSPWNVPDETTVHLCRGCVTCYYIWSEYPAGPDDLARARSVMTNDD
jgi:hypothetical protein